jgi:hypothetical protein
VAPARDLLVRLTGAFRFAGLALFAITLLRSRSTIVTWATLLAASPMAAITILVAFPMFASTVLWRLLRTRPAIQASDLASQVLDVALVGVLLHFGKFERLENFLHGIEHFLQGRDATVYLLDRLGNGGGSSGTKIFALGTWRRSRRGSLDTFTALDRPFRNLSALFFEWRIRQRRFRKRRIAQWFAHAPDNLSGLIGFRFRVSWLACVFRYGRFMRGGSIARGAGRSASASSTASASATTASAASC